MARTPAAPTAPTAPTVVPEQSPVPPPDTQPTVRDAIEERLPRLTRSHAALARYVLAHLQEVAFMSAADLAARLSVSEPTVIRFAKALGYPGYQALRKDTQRFLRLYLGPGDKIRSFLGSAVERSHMLDAVFDTYARLLRETGGLVSRDAFDRAVAAICKARRVFAFGQGAGVILPELLEFRLQRCDISTLTLTRGGRDLFEKLHLITGDDVLVAFTFFQTDEDGVIVLEHARSVKATTILVADSVESELARDVDIILFVKRGDVGVFHSLAVPVALVEALVLAVVAADEDRCLSALDRLHELRARYVRGRVR